MFFLVTMLSASVSDDLESTQHLAHGEKANDLRDDNTSAYHFLCAHVPDSAE